MVAAFTSSPKESQMLFILPVGYLGLVLASLLCCALAVMARRKRSVAGQRMRDLAPALLEKKILVRAGNRENAQGWAYSKAAQDIGAVGAVEAKASAEEQERRWKACQFLLCVVAQAWLLLGGYATCVVQGVFPWDMVPMLIIIMIPVVVTSLVLWGGHALLWKMLCR